MHCKAPLLVIIVASLIAVLIIDSFYEQSYAKARSVKSGSGSDQNLSLSSTNSSSGFSNNSSYTGGSLSAGCGYSMVPTQSCGLTPSGANGR
jgi:hypothetical protein